MPVNDVRRLAGQREEEHGYRMNLLVEDVIRAHIVSCLTEELPPQIGEDGWLLLHFTRQTMALDVKDSPQDFLVSQGTNLKTH